MQLEPYKLTTGKPVIVSILFCCASPSGAVAVMPCSGENKSTILNPAFKRAVLESIPVFVVAALLVTSPSCFVYDADEPYWLIVSKENNCYKKEFSISCVTPEGSTDALESFTTSLLVNKSSNGGINVSPS
jgi:hypothetical protein